MEVKKRSMCFHHHIIAVASSILVACVVLLLIGMLNWGVYRKRKAQRRSPASIPVAVLDLDEDDPKSKQGTYCSLFSFPIFFSFTP